MARLESVRKIGRPVGVSETRNRLLDEASQLFAAKGFAGCTLREICDGLGISGPALLHHFGTKKKLYAEVLGRIAESMQPYLPTDEMAADKAGVLSLVSRYLDWTVAHSHYSQLIMRELMENRERVDRAKNLSMRSPMNAYTGFIRRGQVQGTLPAFDAELFPFFFTGAVAHFSAAVPTVRRILDVSSDDDLIIRFRASLLANVASMIDGFAAAGQDAAPIVSIGHKRRKLTTEIKDA